MGNLVHQGSRSLTARLLGRVKNNLQEFVAPQASFAENCFPALSKCYDLRVLNLSLVSESPPLPKLFKTVAHLQQLRVFRLPRSGGFGVHYKPDSFAWPPRLEDLSLSGGIDAHFLHGVVAFPQTLRRLTIEHCPLAKEFAVVSLLRTAVRPLARLESLTIKHMPRLGTKALDDVLLLLPQLQRLNISVDYISPAFMDDDPFHHDKQSVLLSIADPDRPIGVAFSHKNLRTLELTNSGNPGIEDKITPIDIVIAIDDGALPSLRQVRVAKSLLWHSAATSEDAEALADVLQERSLGDWKAREGVFKDMDEDEYQKNKWEEVAGVWAFDG